MRPLHLAGSKAFDSCSGEVLFSGPEAAAHQGGHVVPVCFGFEEDQAALAFSKPSGPPQRDGSIDYH